MGIPCKTYIGDGVYCEFSDGMIRLTTEAGISVDNTIYLEPEVYAGLERFVAAVRRNSVAGWREPHPCCPPAAAAPDCNPGGARQ